MNASMRSCIDESSFASTVSYMCVRARAVARISQGTVCNFAPSATIKGPINPRKRGSMSFGAVRSRTCHASSCFLLHDRLASIVHLDSFVLNSVLCTRIRSRGQKKIRSGKKHHSGGGSGTARCLDALYGYRTQPSHSRHNRGSSCFCFLDKQGADVRASAWQVKSIEDNASSLHHCRHRDTWPMQRATTNFVMQLICNTKFTPRLLYLQPECARAFSRTLMSTLHAAAGHQEKGLAWSCPTIIMDLAPRKRLCHRRRSVSMHSKTPVYSVLKEGTAWSRPTRRYYG
uniref:Uncharacterized protein n=1 Tax=Trichogramma kaykai TaxID=54128 RepID=A0ABD2WE63_9HYME